MTDSEEYGQLSLASAGISAISSIGSAISQAGAYRAQGDIESTISRINGNIASLQSKETLEQGDVEASREELKTEQETGSILAGQGASGIDVSSGSSVLERNAVRSTGEQDALTIKNNAQRQAFGYNMQALQDTYKGQFAELTAKAQADQTILNGGLQAIERPLSMYANSLRWQRYEGGTGDRKPFPNKE